MSDPVEVMADAISDTISAATDNRTVWRGREAARSVVAALDAAGWAVVPKVPKVPTEAMLAPARAVRHYTSEIVVGDEAADVWNTMIDAALK